jgi:glycosyltransferase involved in cell wall biosynthesis
MKILHVLPSLNLRGGGSVVSCVELCRELARQGEDVAICASADVRSGSTEESGEAGETKVFRVAVGRGPYGFSATLFTALRKVIRDADIVHIHGLYRFHLVVATMLCRRYEVPYVVKPHGSLDPYLFRVRRWRKVVPERFFVRPSLAHASAVHFTSQEEMTLAVSTGLLGVCENGIVANGIIVREGLNLVLDDQVTPSQFVNTHPETAGKRIVLFLGRINFKKGLDILAKAFAAACHERDDLWLVIAGPDNEGYSKKVRYWLESEGVLGRTTFTGILLGEQKQAAYQAASVFVLPSYTENFGMTIVEALNCGVPVVISTKVNIWREIVDAGAGIATECDADEVSQAILRLVDDPVTASEMGVCGRKLVQQYSWQAVAADMRTEYRRLLDSTAKRTRSASLPARLDVQLRPGGLQSGQNEQLGAHTNMNHRYKDDEQSRRWPTTS